jgi:hypothetical protein
MKRLCFISLLLLSITRVSFAENIPRDLITAFKTGDASKLAGFFNQSVEITLFEKQEIYSKTQAEMILRDFFKQHPPLQFKILHQGGKDNSKYAIGNLICETNSYRITFMIKIVGGNSYIHQLRIENNYVE